MGIYLNPDNNEFRLAINDDVYIDKSELIIYTNSRIGKATRYLCVSRPRRFGKSMAADMLVAYYSKNNDSHDLFKGLKIEKDPSYEEHLNQHHVVRLDVQRFLNRMGEGTLEEKIQKSLMEDLLDVFPDVIGLDLKMDLAEAFEKIYATKKASFIFIIDEWDCIFRMAPNDKEAQRKYLDFLRNLFKGAPYVDLVYMTGILPIKKYGEHSAINMFDEYSMTSSKGLGPYFGFTDAEVRKECEKQNVDYEPMKKWYDGYLMEGQHIYNPKSVSNALRFKHFENYWTGTETYEALKVYIDRNFDGLKEAIVEMLGGGRCKINTRHFQNDMMTFDSKDDVLTLLVHLGYLTYEEAIQEVFIPNYEIKEEFLNTIEKTNWRNIMFSLDRSLELLEDTWAMDGGKVAKTIDAIHEETTSIIQYNNENSLRCVLYIAYYSASAYYLKPLQEMPSGKGYADLVYLPLKDSNKPALVVELKWNKSAKGAIQQIHEKGYAKGIESYAGEVLLVGINYDKETKHHTCAIEKYVKA